MFSLEELNANNYDALSKLKIKESQKDFVKDFKGCIEYQKEYPFLKIYGIKHDNTYIGLTAFARWDSDLSIPIEKRWCWFDEFFLDAKYQHLGYGKEIIPIVLSKMKEIYHPEFIVLSVRNDNPSAIKLYLDLGFKKTNLVYSYATDTVRKVEFVKPTDEFVMYKYI